MDALGGVTTFEYSDFDVLTARTGPDGFGYAFSYDTDLHLTQVTNPQGLTWDYVYDPVGRVMAETDFGDRTLTYGRDAAGRLVSRTDVLGQTIRYERDELDRVVRKDAAGAVTTFAYDSGDQLAEAVGPDATLTRLRDRYGRLKSETVNGRTTAFAHDQLGRRTGRTTPTGAVSTWTYDAVGSRTSLTGSGLPIIFGYDAVGQEITRRIGDTITLSSRYDHGGRLTTQHVTRSGHSIQRRDYTYRADGNPTGLDDQLAGAKTLRAGRGRRGDRRPSGGLDRAVRLRRSGQPDDRFLALHPPWPEDAVGPREYAGTTRTACAG
ncbi:hypothetical protein [Streptomyces sp. ISL-66]|uniref:hypothetical protein n=1 Tax=Streptomyces sp. ISL-66 TaxID=2819186 RepID=UPI0027E40645|nr:hypothetical protein [Streptomyces sp. ISL-66]